MATYPAKIYSFYYSESGGGMDTGGQIAAFDEKELMCISFFFFYQPQNIVLWQTSIY